MSGTVSPDAIFAPASGHGRAAVAVIRLSGPRTPAVLRALLGDRLPDPRRASLRTLRDPRDRIVLDQALVLWMPGPGTFTGEDQAELHLHGGVAVRMAVLRALGRQPGCRPADPGEFTRRAFLNGRMDLTAVEGLADLIDAETEAQRRQATRQLQGEFGVAVDRWRARLLGRLARLEALLDFSDEEDVPGFAGPLDELAAVAAEVATAVAGAERGERIREGVTVVIAGPPNAGKSTLLNALAKREVAIVSPIPGTTRDAIEVRCDLGGLAVTLVDTAGLRDSQDAVEQEGIARARRSMDQADLVLWLTPSGEAGQAVLPSPAGATCRRIRTKSDLGGCGLGEDLAVSARSGEGLDDLLAMVAGFAGSQLQGAGEAIVTRERHRHALNEVLQCLARAQASDHAPELAAEDLRLALRALGRITGRVDVEDVLDHIFSSFCIGK